MDVTTTFQHCSDYMQLSYTELLNIADGPGPDGPGAAGETLME